jgi:5-(carboxyamino)imidazole ribonucleotide mutase
LKTQDSRLEICGIPETGEIQSCVLSLAVLSLSGMETPLVGIIMGSTSDWPTMEHAARTLEDFGVAWEAQVVSAHRTPDKLFSYATEARGRGLKCIIGGAGGAAHLPGMTAAITDLPVLGVPVESHALKGMDSLLSIVQMPGGIPTATFAIGKAGAINAALFAVAMLAGEDKALLAKLQAFRKKQNETVKAAVLPELVDPNFG